VKSGRRVTPEIYLDWNATTPPHPAVLAAMEAARSVAWGNPSSVHGAGRRARALVDDARSAVAALAGRDPRDVIFTGSGTEANNLALAGARLLVTSRLEHPSVTRVAEEHERAGGEVRWLPVAPDGCVSAGAVEEALAGTSGATLAVAAVNHETGVVQPLPAIAEVAKQRGARLHVDAVQAVGRVRPELWRHGDSFAIAAHKLRGPKGIGALIVSPGWVPRPVLRGGAQERGLRPGTQDAVAAAGFAAAVARIEESVRRYGALEAERDGLERALADIALVNGAGAARAPHVSSLAFQGGRSAELAAALDLEGVRVSSGSACSAGTSEPSQVIAAMHGAERALATLRVSLGEETTSAEVAGFLQALRRVLARATVP
jgi:cysteine desulfurase